MHLKKHIIDTIKEWQLKIGYREGNMKLYYPGESMAVMLGIFANGAEDYPTKENVITEKQIEEIQIEEKLIQALSEFCDEQESLLGRIKITGSYERYCLEIPAKGCAYVACKVEEPAFLKRFLTTITAPGNTMEQIRECFEGYATEHGTSYVEEEMSEGHAHAHGGHAFYFTDETTEEYVYWVEENEFGLTYHRFIKADFETLKI